MMLITYHLRSAEPIESNNLLFWQIHTFDFYVDNNTTTEARNIKLTLRTINFKLIVLFLVTVIQRIQLKHTASRRNLNLFTSG